MDMAHNSRCSWWISFLARIQALVLLSALLLVLLSVLLSVLLLVLLLAAESDMPGE